MVRGKRHTMNNNFLSAFIASVLLLLLLTIAQKVEQAEGEEEVKSKWAELVGDELDSELSINPSDQEECGKLDGHLLLFSDFCVQARDHVMGDVKRNVHQLVGSISSLFLSSFDKMGIDAKKVREAAENGLKDHGSNRDEISSKRRAEAIRSAEETQVGDTFELQEESGNKGFPNPFGPILWAISAIGNTIGRQVMHRLDQLSKAFGLDKLQAAVGGTCDRIGHYERHLRIKFEQVRNELAEELGLGEEDDFRRLELEQLPCMTLSRVLRLQGVCRFGANLQQHPLLNLLLQGQKVAKFVVENRNIRV